MPRFLLGRLLLLDRHLNTKIHINFNSIAYEDYQKLFFFWGCLGGKSCCDGSFPGAFNKDNIVTRLNIRVRYHNLVLSFHLTKQIPMLVFCITIRFVNIFHSIHLLRWTFVVLYSPGILLYNRNAEGLWYTNRTLQNFSSD